MFLLAALVLAPREQILAVDNMVMGSCRRGKWAETDVTFAKRHKVQGFYTFGVGRAERRPSFYGFGQDQSDGPTFLSSEDASSDMSPMISGIVPRVPRRVQALPLTNPAYEAIARAALARKGIRVAKARLTGLFRVDLDGDGTQEILLSATSAKPKDTGFAKGAYSIVLLRTVKGETPLEFVTAGADTIMDEKRVRGIADLDGDGRMEILTTGNAEEFNKATLWSYRAGIVRKLLEGAAAY